MRDSKRIDRILKLIRKIWKKNQDLRLGQLLLIALTENVFYTEDKDLEERLKKEYEKYLKR